MSPSSPALPRPAMNIEAFADGIQAVDDPAMAHEVQFVQATEADLPQLFALCDAAGISLHDTIQGQLAELAETRFPATGAEADRDRFVDEVIADHGGLAGVGYWVYFPWNSRLVHVLAPDDYFDVITNRNQDKITRAEQLELRNKRVGVIGLSVGAEAAVTIAQEHLCGVIRIADFDTLELSNLNRINAGIDDLGVNKAHLVARRIARINPYLRVEVFDQGIDTASAGEFLSGLDLLVEECDDLQLKWWLRGAAREQGLDIVFAADERGMLSVEPYSRCPDMLPFHGLASGAPAAREDYAGPAEFMRALTEWLGGWETISERSRASVERIGTEICGYPQLAGEPRLAAAQLAHAARRLLLGEHLPPQLIRDDLERELTSRR